MKNKLFLFIFSVILSGCGSDSSSETESYHEAEWQYSSTGFMGHGYTYQSGDITALYIGSSEYTYALYSTESNADVQTVTYHGVIGNDEYNGDGYDYYGFDSSGSIYNFGDVQWYSRYNSLTMSEEFKAVVNGYEYVFTIVEDQDISSAKIFLAGKIDIKTNNGNATYQNNLDLFFLNQTDYEGYSLETMLHNIHNNMSFNYSLSSSPSSTSITIEGVNDDTYVSESGASSEVFSGDVVLAFTFRRAYPDNLYYTASWFSTKIGLNRNIQTKFSSLGLNL